MLMAGKSDNDNDVEGKCKRYYLGENYPDVYFTGQEARCMKYFLAGLSDVKIAERLELSHRTIMFYYINMQAKLTCTNKAELIEKVKKSDFLNYIYEL